MLEVSGGSFYDMLGILNNKTQTIHQSCEYIKKMKDEQEILIFEK